MLSGLQPGLLTTELTPKPSKYVKLFGWPFWPGLKEAKGILTHTHVGLSLKGEASNNVVSLRFPFGFRLASLRFPFKVTPSLGFPKKTETWSLHDPLKMGSLPKIKGL